MFGLCKKLFTGRKHNDVIQKILRKARHGTNVFYIMGNHDEMLRKFIPMHFGSIKMVNRVIHETVKGKKYLVVHGDAWDGVMKYAKSLASSATRKGVVSCPIQHTCGFAGNLI